MRAVLQRVSEASVEVDGKIISEVGAGFLILICAMAGDDESGADQLVSKICKLRVFGDENGKMNRSLWISGAVRWWSVNLLWPPICHAATGRGFPMLPSQKMANDFTNILQHNSKQRARL